MWVTQNSEKRGQTAKLRYLLKMSAGQNEGELVVRMSELEFLELGGKDATTPAMRQALAATLAMARAVPDWVVDAEGNFLRMEGLEELIERLVGLNGALAEVGAAQREKILETLRSPAMASTLEQACGDHWNVWVGAWVGFDVAPGGEEQGDRELPFMGTAVPACVTMRNQGPATDHPGYFELSITSVSDGPSARDALAESLDATGQGNGADGLREVSMSSHVVAVTDPQSQKPLRSSRTKTTRIVMQGAIPQEQVERAEYTFHWDGDPAAAK